MKELAVYILEYVIMPKSFQQNQCKTYSLTLYQNTFL